MKYYGTAIALLCISVSLCAQKHSRPFESYVRFQSASSPGVITVQASGFAKKKNESAANALDLAFTTLFYMGIAGSQYDMPLVRNRNAHSDSALYKMKESGYAGFLIDNKIVADDDATKKEDGVKGRMTVCSITINCDAVKRYLEQEGVIRKFGI